MLRSALHLWLATTCCLVGLAVADEEPLERYFAALRDRGLYVLAEEYAVTRLSDEQLSPSNRAVLTVQLIESLLEHGTFTQGEQRQELWNEAQRTLDSATAAAGEESWSLILEAYRAIVPAIQGSALAWESTLRPEDVQLRSDAGTKLDTAVAGLQAAAERLASRVVPRSGNPRATPVDITRLRQRVDFHLAESLLLRAELLPVGHDRAAMLLDADEACVRLLRSHPDDELTTKTRILQAHVARLQGDEPRAIGVLSGIVTTKLGDILKDQILAERVRLELSAGRTDAAVEMIAPRLRTASAPADELRAAAVDVLLDAWRLAGVKHDPQLQQRLLAEAQSQHEKTFGKWGQWTAVRLERIHEDAELGTELAALVREARANWQQRHIERAAQQFGQASHLASSSNLEDQAVEFAFTQGSILLDARRWQSAANAFSELLERHPQHPRAADADLLRCYCVNRMESDDPNPTGAYERALKNHLANFPQAATRGEAIWMLADQDQRRGRWTQAVAEFEQIPSDHPRHDEAKSRILSLYQQVLDQPQLDVQERGVWEARALAAAGSIGGGLLEQSSLLNPAQCRTLLECARVQLQCREPDYAQADRMLLRVVEQIRLEQRRAELDAATLPQAWVELERSTAQTRIFSFAAQQRSEEARFVLKGLADAPETLLRVLGGLSELMPHSDPRHHYELGYLLHSTVEELAPRRNQLTPEQQRLFDECSAEANVAMGDFSEAAAGYRALLQASPQDARLIRRLIDVHQQRGQAGDLDQAQELWTRLERMEKQGTPVWIEARINIADLLRRQGRPDEARKLLGVTRTLYPKMGSEELKDRSDALWDALNSSATK